VVFPGWCGVLGAVFSLYGCFAVGADADEFDRDAGVFFDGGDVASCVVGELLLVSCVGDVALESGEFVEDGCGVLEFACVGCEGVGAALRGVVGGAEFEGVESFEDIEEHERDGGGAVDLHGVAECDEVEPSDASGPAGGCAEFVAAFSDAFGGVVCEFCREGSGADAGAVGLADAEDVCGVGWRGSGAGSDAGGGGVGGCDEGVCSVVDIEEGGVGAFEEDGFLLA